MVEVDSSYYGLPAPPTAQLWAERTPPGSHSTSELFGSSPATRPSPRCCQRTFQEALALPPTRHIYCRDLCQRRYNRKLWRRFFEAIEPLRLAKKVGAIHFQFGPWTISGGEPRKHVEHCATVMEGRLMAVEFRNKSWWTERTRDSTLAFERERRLVNLIVDGPQGFASSVPAVWEVTSPEPDHSLHAWTQCADLREERLRRVV
jgi:uncharacterized protein YecE (DUF72 family)